MNWGDWPNIGQIFRTGFGAWGLLTVACALVGSFCVLLYVFKRRGFRQGPSFESEGHLKLYEYWRDGHDLNAVQLIDFYMSFDTQMKAQEAFFGSERNFAVTEHDISNRDGQWKLRISLNFAPNSVSAIIQIGEELTRIAEHIGGTYEGWALRGESV